MRCGDVYAGVREKSNFTSCNRRFSLRHRCQISNIRHHAHLSPQRIDGKKLLCAVSHDPHISEQVSWRQHGRAALVAGIRHIHYGHCNIALGR